MDRKKKNILISLLIVSYIIVYRFFVYTKLLKYNESISASFLIILFSISMAVYSYRKIIKNDLNKKILINTCISVFLYFVAIYGIGLVTGFLTNSYNLKISGIISNVFPVAVAIICSELFRYVFIRANKDSKFFIVLITTLMILLEINLQVRYDSFSTIEQIFKFTSVTVLPIIMKNIMCTYFVYQNDYRSCLVYRLILDTYFYYIPLEPDLGDYLISVANLLLPFIIFIKSIKINDDFKYRDISVPTKTFKVSDIPFALVVGVIVLMIFGIGPVKIIGIETPSMTPNIKVGDAVVIDKKTNRDKLKEKDIIAYKNDDGVIVVHRIININADGTFITKGDYNNTSDPLYVNKKQVVGKVMFKIPFIAYPAIIFRGD